MKYLRKFNEEFTPIVTDLFYKFAFPHKDCGENYIWDPETNSCIDTLSFPDLQSYIRKFGIDKFQPYQMEKPLHKHLMSEVVNIIYRCKSVFVKAYSISLNSRYESESSRIEEVISLIERETKYGDLDRCKESLDVWFSEIPKMLSETNKIGWLNSSDGRKWGIDLGKFELYIELLRNLGSEVNDQQKEEIQKKLDLLSSNIFFYGSETKIREYSEPEINAIVDVLQLHPTVKVVILGWHNTPSGFLWGGPVSIDIARAESIRDILVSKGIELKRITSKGMGESKIVPDDEYGIDKEGNTWNKNMRVEIKIVE
jgi:hypothetical protein